MTKTAILQLITEMEHKLAALRVAVEQWPETLAAERADALTGLEQEETEIEPPDLSFLFTILRTTWHIPPDLKPDMPLEALQQAMAEGRQENWASREIMRMREE
jgi:hypothetical protein